MTDNNKNLFKKSQQFIPGGVNSPVRAFSAVGGTPIFFKKGLGSRLWDENNKEYIDYINSWGPMILGHAHPEILSVVKEASKESLSFGAPTSKELEIAELIVKLVPSIEQVRLVSSGTEATMSAIRVSRGYTEKDKILKFEGCYHGHADPLLVKAGSGALTFGQPSSAGVPKGAAKDTFILPYNDTELLKEYFDKYGDNLACVIIEPIVGNMNLIIPELNFLNKLINLCN
jgi:glutamate-1-semialdehyde 2,1-aminomutase